jgi:pimeloyl-ACP methyl ester carboxylesterase
LGPGKSGPCGNRRGTPPVIAEGDVPLRILVITVHGIRTFGQWQRRLETVTHAAASARGDEVTFKHKHYGYFSVIKFLNPWSRWAEVRRFSDELAALLGGGAGTPYDRVCLVGHSFGTHIIAHALQRLPRDGLRKVDTIVLAGSVLPKLFPWPRLLGSRVVRLVNDCGTNDDILPVNALLPLGSGVAGRNGFDGIEDEDFSNRFFEFGHSGYFYGSKRRPDAADDNWFMARYWVPLLLNNDPVESADERRNTLFSGLIVGLVDRTERFKWTVPVLLLSLVAVLVLYEHSLTRNALNAQTSVEALRTLKASDSAAMRTAAASLLTQLDKIRAVERTLLNGVERIVWGFTDYKPSYRPPVLVGAAHRLALNSQQLSRVTVNNKPQGSGDEYLLRSWFNSAGHFMLEDGRGMNIAIDPATGAPVSRRVYARQQPVVSKAGSAVANQPDEQSLRLSRVFPSEVGRYVSREGNRAILWDVTKSEPEQEWTLPDGIGVLNYLIPFRERRAFVGVTLNGQTFLFGSDGSIRQVAEALTDLSISNDDRYVALTAKSRITLLDSENPATTIAVPACGGADDQVRADVFVADSLHVLVSADDHVCLFDIKSPRMIDDIWNGDAIGTAYSFPTAQFILAIKQNKDEADNGDATCLIAEAGRQFELKDAKRWPCSFISSGFARSLIQTSRDGDIIAMPGSGRTNEHQGAHLVERRSGRTFRQLEEHLNRLFAIAIDSRGDHVVSASRLVDEGNDVDKSTKLFLSDIVTPVFTTPKDSSEPTSVVFSTDDSIFSVVSLVRSTKGDEPKIDYSVEFFGTLQGPRVTGGGLERLPHPRRPGSVAGCPGWDASSDIPREKLIASAVAALSKLPPPDVVCEVYFEDHLFELRKVEIENKSFVLVSAMDPYGGLSGLSIFTDGGKATVDISEAGGATDAVAVLNDSSKGVATIIYRDAHVERRRYSDGAIVGSAACLCRDATKKPEVIGVQQDPQANRIYVYAKVPGQTRLIIADRDSLQVREEFDISDKIGTGGLYRGAVGASHAMQFTDSHRETWIYVSSPGAKFDPQSRNENESASSSGEGEEIVIRNARTGKTRTLSCVDKEGRVLSNDGYPTLRSAQDGRTLGTSHLGFSDGGYRADRSVVVWDVETGQCRGVLGDHSELYDFWFNQDGSLLITLGVDETRVWHVPTMSLLTEYKGRVAVAVDQNGALHVAEDSQRPRVAVRIPASDGEWIKGLEAIVQIPTSVQTMN